MRKFCTLAVVISLWLTACGSASAGKPVKLSALCREKVSALAALEHRDKNPPIHLIEGGARQDGDFDVMQYFSALDQLSMQAGFVLDYAYFGGQIGGEPVLYPRPSNQPAYQTYEQLTTSEGERYTREKSSFYTSVQVDDSEAGFLQFVILRVMANQFYQNWHAKYNDDRLICDREDLEKVLQDPGAGEFDLPKIGLLTALRARLFRPDPQVDLQADKVVVEIEVFKKWGGFTRRTYTISRQFPHEIINIENKSLAPYDCGISY